ncbi:hypothetical protein FHW69_001596 [Luteibacter sp. Sphag1AF]|uniref:phage adaptor protein n=1 Tax=Luteibacter sp. Sphag1AF TaxID=2587031 RepID=UPI001613B6F1|nr:hypothetical protein [Luteibacter sp. Sphag1AF]MBB3226995.1 hypothetical protein [Luteibacter sp. Sphag1AF]
MINDYSTLQAAVAAWLSRADLAARIPDFIQLAEARISAEIRVRQMDAALSGVLANYQATLP